MFLKLREEKGTKTSYKVRKELRILSVLGDEVCRLKESGKEHFTDLDTSTHRDQCSQQPFFLGCRKFHTSKTKCQKNSTAEKKRCRKIRFQ